MVNNDKNPINSDKGHSYEYDVSSFFQSQGYLTRRAIPIQYGTSNQEATDIDVLGISYTSPFKKRIIICDCKNKVRSKPHERIFWAKGLGEFMKASEVYVSLPKCSWEFTKFASQGEVRILTSDHIHQYSELSTYGLADQTFYNDYLEKIDRIAKGNKKLNETLLLIRKLYLKDDPYVVLNVTLDTLKNVVWKNMYLMSPDSVEFEAWKYLCCELTVLLSIQILSICCDVLGAYKGHRENHIKEKLTYGDLEPIQVKKFLVAAEDWANEVVKSTIPAELLPSSKVVSFGKFPAPVYSPDVVGLVERAYSNPEWYINLPQILDFLLFEVGLKGKEFNEQTYRKIFKSDYAEERLKVARNILAFIKDKTGINWAILWPKGEGQLRGNDNVKVAQEKLL